MSKGKFGMIQGRRVREGRQMKSGGTLFACISTPHVHELYYLCFVWTESEKPKVKKKKKKAILNQENMFSSKSAFSGHLQQR